MKKLFLISLFLVFTNTVLAQDNELKKQAISLIKIDGTDAQIKMAKAQLLEMVAAEKKAAFIIEFDATLPALYDKMAEVYLQVYTKEDINAMLAFYNTPVGKKIQEKSDDLLSKNAAATQEWGQGLQAMLMKYMQ